MTFYYLSDSKAETLRHYVYEGSDNSFVYSYVLSPLAQFLVNNFTPKSVAPNTITLIGLLWMVCSYLVLWYYCPNLDDAVRGGDDDDGETETVVPRWPFLFNGAAMLIYQTFDNMDGKQARRTGSSSPLGLLFDHGCDAFNVMLGSTNWMCAVGVGLSGTGNDGNDLLRAALMVYFPLTLFFVQTWEEYHVGRMDLPVINGPTEGLILGACQMFVSAAYGVAYWHTTSTYDKLLPWLPSSWQHGEPITNLDVLLSVMVYLSVQELVLKIISVVSRHGWRSLDGLLPMLSLVALSVLIFGSDGADAVLTRNPRLYLNLCSALFVEMTTALMLDHMLDTKFRPFRWCLAPLLVWGACVVASSGVVSSNDNNDAFAFTKDADVQDRFFRTYAFVVVVFLACKIRVVVHEMCDVLGIWCFDIVNPRKLATTRSGAKTF